MPVVVDDEDAHRDAIARGLEADVLVTSGGVSMGEHDLVRRIEAELGVREVFWGVAVKPGKPISFGVRDRTLVFGLPGNPVSSLVGALVFVATGLRALQGAGDPLPRFAQGVDVGDSSTKRPARRVRAGDSRGRRRRRPPRGDLGAGVAHDRQGGGSQRARPRAARRRRARGRRSGSLPLARLAEARERLGAGIRPEASRAHLRTARSGRVRAPPAGSQQPSRRSREARTRAGDSRP